MTRELVGGRSAIWIVLLHGKSNCRSSSCHCSGLQNEVLQVVDKANKRYDTWYETLCRNKPTIVEKHDNTGNMARKRTTKQHQDQRNFSWPYGEKAYSWLNSLETVLQEQAVLAGLHDHSSTVGFAREFFVKQVLRTVLPPMVHIGSGRIIDAAGQQSRQMDVIIYDARFPVLETAPGIGSYFIEGVIATVEVKSTIDKKKLYDALDNCLSAKRGEINVNLAQFSARSRELPPDRLFHIFQAYGDIDRDGLADSKVLSQLLPKTYVFAFNSEIKKGRTIAKHVQNWFERADQPLIGFEPCVPNVVIAGSICGTSCHDKAPDPPRMEEMKKRSVWPVMRLWRLRGNDQAPSRRLGLLICDLMSATCERLGTLHHGTQVEYGPTGHFAPALVEYSCSAQGEHIEYVTCSEVPTAPDPQHIRS